MWMAVTIQLKEFKKLKGTFDPIAIDMIGCKEDSLLVIYIKIGDHGGS